MRFFKILVIFSFLFNLFIISGKAKDNEKKIRKAMGFEDLKYWRKAELIPEKKLVKEGKQAALWKDTEDNARPYTKVIPHDWSKYKAISLWIYSKVANNAKISIVLSSENEDTDGSDYYMTRILINWKGWKKIVIPFDEFQSEREPVGFNKIDRLRFAATGYKTGGAKPDTELILDGIKLLTAKELEKNKKYIYHFESKKKKKSKSKKVKIKEDWSE